MGDHSSTCRLSVSRALFQLVTEAIRLRSNQTGRLATLDGLIGDLLWLAARGEPLDVDLARDHLEALPGTGDLPLRFVLDAGDYASFAGYRSRVGDAMDQAVGLEDAISLLCFFYVVDREAEAALALIKPFEESSEPKASDRPEGGKVVPIRR